MVTLKQVHFTAEHSIIMKVADGLANKGPRQSPRRLALKMLGTGALCLSTIAAVFYAATSHGGALQDAWSMASLNLSKALSGGMKPQPGKTTKKPRTPLKPSSDSPLIKSPEKIYRSQTASARFQPGQRLRPGDPWPVEKLLIEVPYRPTASPSYGVRNNER